MCIWCFLCLSLGCGGVVFTHEGAVKDEIESD